MPHYVYYLTPPRPSFAADMDAGERAVMGEHAGYWRRHMAEGRVHAFGPVDGPDGSYGIALVTADGEDEARALADGDPVLRSGRGFSAEIVPMLGLVTPADLPPG
ncbi:MAG: YciI family protein [Solirubrobacteraceae bacterium]